MGIPYYFRYLISKSPHILSPYAHNFDNVMIDANAIVYKCLKKYSDEKTSETNLLIDLVIDQIHEYFNYFKPKKLCFIAFDGVAPVAKMKQQRSRRFKKMFEIPLTEESKKAFESDPFNTAEITAGTLFMKTLGKRVQMEFESNEMVYVSTSEEEGEGEHKIFQLMHENKERYREEKTAVLGNDADLIMISLLNQRVFPNLALLREEDELTMEKITKEKEKNKHLEFLSTSSKSSFSNQESTNQISFLSSSSFMDNETTLKFDKREKEEKINLTLNENENIVVVDIGLLRLTLEKEFKISSLDYVFFCFLMGNDFLPHCPSINIRNRGVDTLMINYIRCFYECPPVDPTDKTIFPFSSFMLPEEASGDVSFLIDDITFEIRWDQVRRLIEQLSIEEEKRMCIEFSSRTRNENNYLSSESKDGEDIERKLKMLPSYERELEKKINPIKDRKWREKYYSFLFPFVNSNGQLTLSATSKTKNSESFFRENICREYCQTLQWVWNYYCQSTCIDWRWKYPHFYPPLFHDLSLFLPSNSTSTLSFSFSTSTPVHPYTQLAYVLPRNSLHLLPIELKDHLLSLFPSWYVADETEINFLWVYCMFFWEAHPLLPEMNINLLDESILSFLSFDELGTKTKEEKK